MNQSHTCPVCSATLHTSGSYVAWITKDGRVILEASTARPTDQKWLEIHPVAQNWLAEIFRLAHETEIAHRADLAART
jgi:hypothetical protein